MLQLSGAACIPSGHCADACACVRRPAGARQRHVGAPGRSAQAPGQRTPRDSSQGCVSPLSMHGQDQSTPFSAFEAHTQVGPCHSSLLTGSAMDNCHGSCACRGADLDQERCCWLRSDHREAHMALASASWRARTLSEPGLGCQAPHGSHCRQHQRQQQQRSAPQGPAQP